MQVVSTTPGKVNLLLISVNEYLLYEVKFPFKMLWILCWLYLYGQNVMELEIFSAIMSFLFSSFYFLALLLNSFILQSMIFLSLQNRTATTKIFSNWVGMATSIKSYHHVLLQINSLEKPFNCRSFLMVTFWVFLSEPLLVVIRLFSIWSNLLSRSSSIGLHLTCPKHLRHNSIIPFLNKCHSKSLTFSVLYLFMILPFLLSPLIHR